ncbi:ABC transporter permease [Frateuria hangzhouensis]|uniref:ABC transporter permease n=1 Tax=Frateuria hangzhouensis TaxID=2995589 RepID=UPI002260AAB8|nr:ABC transporter permease [Frateuria sp. STR12]MCX7514143.1 ABC transporter permease [Frateuria sp. STR12]
MNTLATALLVEHRKLRRSLALLLAASVPLLIAVFLFFNLLRGHQARPWQQDMQMGAAIWAFFMLPMGVTALTVLVAQVEHVPRSWDHLRALPVPRWHFFLAKAAWVLGIVALMSAGVLAGSAAALYLAGRIEPAVAPQGPLDMGYCVLLYGRMYLSAFLLVAVQLWLALRYASFVPALAAGIGGTFFAVVASSAKVGVVLPWQVPINLLASDPLRARIALLWGCLGGVAALALMLVHLAHREVR